MATDKEQFHVLVTGGTGIIGNVIIPLFLKEGFFITALVGPSRQMLKQACVLHDRLTWLKGDFNEALRTGFCNLRKHKGKTAVIHLAGKSDVDWCEQNLQEAYHSNVTLTFDILKRCHEASIERFLFPSSALVYGEYLGRPARETDLPKPETWYGATKLAAEVLIQGYTTTCNLKADILRIPNIYGYYSSPKTVIGKIIKQAATEKVLQISDPTPVRDFIYDKDVAKGFLKTIMAPSTKKYRIMNVSTGSATQIGDVVRIAQNILGQTPQNINPVGHKSVSSKLVLDNKLLRSETSWIPETSLSEGLAEILKSLR